MSRISCCSSFSSVAMINTRTKAVQEGGLLAHNSRLQHIVVGKPRQGLRATHLQSRAERHDEWTHATYFVLIYF